MVRPWPACLTRSDGLAVCLKKKGTQSQKKQSVGIIRCTGKPIQAVHNIPGLDPIIQHLQLNGKQFQFEVDSGARHNLCSRQVWTEVGRPKLWPALIRYISAAGDPLPILGTFHATACMGNPPRFEAITLNVSPRPHLNLLGRTAIHQLGIDIFLPLHGSGNVQYVDKVHTVQSDDASDLALRNAFLLVCRNFPDLFKAELGCLRDVEVEVAFKPNANPIFCKPQTVPYAILEGLNSAYDEGIRKVIWIPIEFNDYGILVVPVQRNSFLVNRRPGYGLVATIHSMWKHSWRLKGTRYPIQKIWCRN